MMKDTNMNRKNESMKENEEESFVESYSDLLNKIACQDNPIFNDGKDDLR